MPTVLDLWKQETERAKAIPFYEEVPPSERLKLALVAWVSYCCSRTPPLIQIQSGGVVYLYELIDFFLREEGEEEKEEPEEEEKRSILTLRDLSVRIRRILYSRGGIETLADLIASTESDLLKLQGFGKVALREVKIFLSRGDPPLSLRKEEE